MHYPTPTPEAIDAEVARLRPRYEIFIKAQGAEPDETQLRSWAEENILEQIILETEAKAAGKDVNALMQSIVDNVPPATIDDARAYYKANPDACIAPERVHAQHIVLHRHQSPNPADAFQTLLNLRSDITSGKTTWDEAVKQFSHCPQQSDLGFFPRGVMVEAFENAAFNTEEGAISDVIETEFGWHLIHVISHLPEEPMLFEEVRERLLQQLTEQRQREALETFVDSRKPKPINGENL
jgi:parvulin-like peptidyl-prolyl isomerase